MMINEMKNRRSSDLLPMFYDCKYFLEKKRKRKKSARFKCCPSLVTLVCSRRVLGEDALLRL